MVLGDAVTKLQTFVWIFNHVSRVMTWSPACSTLEHQTWSNNQSQHDLLYGGVSLSISLNLKLAPVPYATPKWPIGLSGLFHFLGMYGHSGSYGDIKNQVIWNNKMILSQGKSIYQPMFHKCGIIKVGDLISPSRNINNRQLQPSKCVMFVVPSQLIWVL